MVYNISSHGMGEGAIGSEDRMTCKGVGTNFLLQNPSILDGLEVGACGSGDLINCGVSTIKGSHVGVGRGHAVFNIRLPLECSP